MKHMKRIVALLLATVMVMAMSMSAFAADGDGTTPKAGAQTADNPVSVTGLDDGDVAHFYKVIEWQAADETHKGGWVFTEAFKSLTEADMKAITGDPAADPKVEPALTAELAGKIARLAKGEGTAVTAADGKAELAITGDKGAGSGLFLVLVTPKDADTVYNPIFVGADYVSGNTSNTWAVVEKESSYSDKAAAKKSKLKLDKTAKTEEELWDDNKSGTTAIGDTVSFTVKTTIPGYGEVYEKPHFVMTDSLNALKLVKGTVKVDKGTKDTDYTIEEKDDGYTITFKESYLKTCVTPTDIVVTYDAIVTTDAKESVNLEKNEVQIQYSHDPKDESDYNIKKDTTQHYTFSLDADVVGFNSSQTGKKTSEIVKVGVKADGTPITETTETSEISPAQKWQGPLEGAVFGLYTDKDCKNAYVPKKADGTQGSALTNITTLADGRMHIEGLDAGTYYLKEISAPEGFIKDDQAHEIKIDAKLSEKTITETIDGKEVTYKTETLDSYTVTVDGKNTSTHKFTNDGKTTDVTWTESEAVEVPSPIKNTVGTELPSTGGIGTTLFYMVGSVLVIGAVVLLVSKRRMNSGI